MATSMQYSRRTRAFSTIETVVAAGILLVIMNFAIQMTFRIDGLWSDVAQTRVAVHELSNQLETLTRLPVDELKNRLEAPVLSELVLTALPGAILQGQLIHMISVIELFCI